MFYIFCDDEKSWSASDFESSSLSYGIGECSLMLSDYFACSIDNISWFFFDFFLEEVLHRYFPDKAESLRVFSIGIWELCLFCYLTDFGFQ